MGKRREPRKPAQVPVRVLGTDAAGRPFAEKLDTLDVSRSGLRLRGLSVTLKLGDTVSVSYKDQKARYRVQWVAAATPTAAGASRWDAGLQNPSPERQIFDFPLPEPILDNYAGLSSHGLRSGPIGGRPGAEAGGGSGNAGGEDVPKGERRALPRLRCSASIELHPLGQAAPIMAGIADLSLGGCFVDMPMPLPIGTRLKVVLWLDAVKVQTPAEVSNSRPGFGIGLHFRDLPPDEQAKLQAYLAKIPRFPFQSPRVSEPE